MDNTAPIKLVNIADRGYDVAKDLRALADALESGELKATSGIVVMQDRVGEIVNMRFLGESVCYSHCLGLLAYAQHQVFRQCQDG